MTDKELKNILGSAYALPATDSEKAFIRRYEKRSLQIFDVIRLEMRYMGVKSLLSGVVLTVLLLVAAKSKDPDMLKTCTSFIPAGLLIPMLSLSESERCGMEELEAASRFSLRFVRIVRMFILGIFSTILLFAAGIILQAAASVTNRLILIVLPYLASTYGSMLVTRKWHSKENVFGVLAVCAFGGLLPRVIGLLKQTGQLPDGVCILLIILLLGSIFRECALYVKESENLSWNYC